MNNQNKTAKTFCEEKCQFYYSPSFVCNMRNQCPLLERLEDAQKEIDKLKLWIFGLYKKADHLSHEDERQSCAYILRDVFGVETEEGMFGEVFLTEKSQKELEELLKEEKEARP